ncbi:MAG: hypothetical protein JWM75_436 [Sphingomonas bacterium]|nr:hypothetical protein [Sphingomonas bacterium]
MVIQAQNLLVRISKPAPMSITKCLSPESMCWKKAQLRPIATTSPIQVFAQERKTS